MRADPPTVAQMAARHNGAHAALLRFYGLRSHRDRPLIGPGAGPSAGRGYATARSTLFRWGCLEHGPVRRDERLRTSREIRLTARGVDLLAAIDPAAGAFARLERAEAHLDDVRSLRAALSV